jgi:hypothetical protein
MKTLSILIKPSFNSTLSDMGYEQNDDYDSDAVLFQQGFDMDYIEVEPGETFQIDDEYQGFIDTEEVKIKYIDKKEEKIIIRDYSDEIILEKGTYLYYLNEMKIEKIY